VHPSAHLSSGQSHSWNSSDRKWLLSQFCTRVHLPVLWIHAKTYIIYIDLQISICQYLSSMVSSVTLIVASSFHRYHRCHLTWSICPDAEAMKSALVFRSHFFWAPRHMSSLDIWLVWHFRLIVLAICWDRSSSCTLEDLTLNMQESWRLFEDRCEESRTSLYQKVVLPNEVPQ